MVVAYIQHFARCLEHDISVLYSKSINGCPGWKIGFSIHEVACSDRGPLALNEPPPLLQLKTMLCLAHGGSWVISNHLTNGMPRTKGFHEKNDMSSRQLMHPLLWSVYTIWHIQIAYLNAISPCGIL